MMNFRSVMLFSEKPEKLAEFYEKVFDKKADWKDEDYWGFKMGEGFLTIGPHDKVKGESKNPERILLNFEVDDVEKEFARMEKLGVEVIASPYHPGDDERMTIATLADPDGNYFQLVVPWDEMEN